MKVFFFSFSFPPVGLDDLGFKTKAVRRGKQIISREVEKYSHKPVFNCSREPELGSR